MSRFLLLLLFLAPVASAQIRVSGAPVPLTQPGDGYAHPVFSPDGRFVALTTPTYDGIWVRDLQSGTTRQLTDERAAGFGMSWSPDGAALVARVARFEDGRRLNAVRILEVESGTSRLVTEYTWRMPAVPAWSPDGSEVVLPSGESLQRFPSDRPAVSGKQAAPALVARHDALVRVGDAANVAVPVEGQAVLAVVPSPAGDRYAVQVMGAGLFVVDANGANLVPLGRGEHPTWSPDGTWIAFMRVEDDGHEIQNADLYAVRADGGDPVRLTFSEDRAELYPAWAPNGAAIAFDDLDSGIVYLLPVTY